MVAKISQSNILPFDYVRIIVLVSIVWKKYRTIFFIFHVKIKDFVTNLRISLKNIWERVYLLASLGHTHSMFYPCLSIQGGPNI